MGEDPKYQRRLLWGEWVELALIATIHAFAALLAIGVLVACIVDYDRHFPNPKFHLSPRYAFVCGGIACATLVYIAWWTAATIRSLRR